ncbi:AAA domain [Trypanosoma vivax]|uniref:CCHC-type domain-containing protein n=1 Tax=Trypanosoma vivax (strain Y486) TaxID=1055687 RepID=G0TTE0_TRYVY|nr:hypothetical protein TRVL_01359 [Trypanosoma vivax]KAH8605592.1 AAA domain [Trypanosoma vivax]CCC47221.1 conserved hypothetical protein [Trypanosoma vivax Y486]
MQLHAQNEEDTELWSDEKRACIDWADPDDALVHEWTFLRIMSFHPALERYAATHPEEKEYWKNIFLDHRCLSEQRAALQEWLDKGLLTMREERWCCGCRGRGHTKRHCELRRVEEVNADGEADRKTRYKVGHIMACYNAHRREIERCKLVKEMQQECDTGGASTVRRVGASAHGTRSASSQTVGYGASAYNKNSKELVPFVEERRRGVVGRIDTEYNIGFVRIPDLGEVKFFTDRVDCCVKGIAVNDKVMLKIDHSRDYPLGVDVRPESQTISAEDVHQFIERCKAAIQPISIIKSIMTHTSEWPSVLRLLSEMPDLEFANAVHVIVELTTFVGNREPIHIPLLEMFLAFVQQEPNGAAGHVFFPNMVERALRVDRQLMQRGEDSTLIERWFEVANFVVLLRQHAMKDGAKIAAVQDILMSLFSDSLMTGKGPLTDDPAAVISRNRKIVAAQQLLHAPDAPPAATLLFPSVDDFALPHSDERSPFAVRNLPVLGETAYSSVEKFITDHCRMLRADAFEAVSRLLPATCLQMPNYVPTEQTQSDIQHARVYDGIRFMGRVITKDKDYATCSSYIFQVQPRSEKALPPRFIAQGTTVCITTCPDRTRLEEGEIFWGIVTSRNVPLLHANMIVVAPCETSASFELLAKKLKRNEQMGKLESSCMLITSVFMMGYKSIMKALSAFVGPLAMPLPMVSTLVGIEDFKMRKQKQPVAYISPHCEYAFQDLIDDVSNRFTLDEGQKKVMSLLPTSDVLLVQGPPGTGKSFIGCRIVEIYVRYKQLIASGDILRSINIDTLPSAQLRHLFPNMVGPIVIITYKNHALDEFLIELLKSGLWDYERPRVAQQLVSSGPAFKADMFPSGKRVVRIGGRSREATLDTYNLNALLHAKTEKAGLNSLKERLFLMNQRLERLIKEIHYLESGRVPRSLFERWLTEEQRKHISYEDREEWLSGRRYVGTSTRTADKLLYLSLLKTRVATALDMGQSLEADSVEEEGMIAASLEPDAGVKRSVFREMQYEDEHRDFNESLHTTYLSVEAIDLAREPPSRPEGVPEELLSLWSLDPPLRHEYYAYLIRKCISTKARDCLLIMDAMKNVVQLRNHAMSELKLELLQGADVVGLTTTGCASNQNLLRSLRPSVLVVEEAAEVLESQLLACMTDSIQQIVLIGDHFQLQPKVETFAYEKFNRLNMSLFERLSFRLKPVCLTEQRRMHPTISRLVRPFYDAAALLDSASVKGRSFISSTGERFTEAVPGLERRVFFWRHTNPEETAHGSRSKVNTLEVRRVLDIVAHITTEGVHQKSITVITPYLAQFRLLRTTLRMNAFSDVTVSTVDLFQGDENDVIILSMVRTEELTEFLRMRNRMIVCCSRARHAMVMVGNDTLLDQSPHWKQVLDLLRKDGCVGDRLPITFGNFPGEAAWLD